MNTATSFLTAAMEAGFTVASGVPCSYFAPLIDAAIDARDIRYVGAANEGDAIAIASGAELGGTRAIAMVPNSGLGNAVSPLTSLSMVFHIPILIVATWRGDPERPADEPQHTLMGRITTPLLDLMEIPWERLTGDDGTMHGAPARAVRHMTRAGTPYALLVERDTFGPRVHRGLTAMPRPLPPTDSAPTWTDERPSRRAALAAVERAARPTDVVLATTGYIARELAALTDRPTRLAMVGSMGCVATLGLGLACAQPRRRIVVLDGDGAALMRLGGLATIGCERPPNLVHVLLDNEVHESTGCQSTVSHAVDLGAVARACGYPRVLRARTAAELAAILAVETRELTFVHVKIASAVDPPPPRPTITPVEAAARLRAALAAS